MLKKVPYRGNLEGKLSARNVQLNYEEKIGGLRDNWAWSWSDGIQMLNWFITWNQLFKYTYNDCFIKHLLIEYLFNKYSVLLFSVAQEYRTAQGR